MHCSKGRIAFDPGRNLALEGHRAVAIHSHWRMTSGRLWCRRWLRCGSYLLGCLLLHGSMSSMVMRLAVMRLMGMWLTGHRRRSGSPLPSPLSPGCLLRLAIGSRCPLLLAIPLPDLPTRIASRGIASVGIRSNLGWLLTVSRCSCIGCRSLVYVGIRVISRLHLGSRCTHGRVLAGSGLIGIARLIGCCLRLRSSGGAGSRLIATARRVAGWWIVIVLSTFPVSSLRGSIAAARLVFVGTATRLWSNISRISTINTSIGLGSVAAVLNASRTALAPRCSAVASTVLSQRWVASGSVARSRSIASGREWVGTRVGV
jgi:hypothetical protein